MAKTPVFVSFDFDNDKVLKDFIIGQSKHEDSPFDVIDHSLKEAAPEKDWKEKARRAIKRSDVVIVMVGPKTQKLLGFWRRSQLHAKKIRKSFKLLGTKMEITLPFQTLDDSIVGAGII
jgi:hypothetical protein